MKKKMRRLMLITMMLVALSLIVSACGSNGSTSGGSSTKKEDFTFAMSGLYPPFNYKDNGKLVGFDVEIGKALAKKMGMNSKPVTNPWETILSALKTGKFQAIIGSMAITPERQKEVNFSDSYYASGSQIFIKKGRTDIKSTDDLKGKKIGIVVSSTYEALAKKYTDSKNVSTYDSDVTALQDLLVKGRIDAVITDKLVGMYAIKQNNLGIQPTADPISLDHMGIAIKKDDKALLKKVNKALAEIKEDGTYAKISKKYFGADINQ